MWLHQFHYGFHSEFIWWQCLRLLSLAGCSIPSPLFLLFTLMIIEWSQVSNKQKSWFLDNKWSSPNFHSFRKIGNGHQSFLLECRLPRRSRVKRNERIVINPIVGVQKTQYRDSLWEVGMSITNTWDIETPQSTKIILSADRTCSLVKTLLVYFLLSCLPAIHHFWPLRLV